MSRCKTTGFDRRICICATCRPDLDGLRAKGCLCTQPATPADSTRAVGHE